MRCYGDYIRTYVHIHMHTLVGAHLGTEQLSHQQLHTCIFTYVHIHACLHTYTKHTRGPSWNYGGHDYYLTNSGTYNGEEKVSMSNNTEIVPNTPALMTIVVTQTSVTFYRNLDVLGVVNISRPVTDCFNSLEGIFIGDTGLKIGQLRFFPKALSITSIEEIYLQGSTLDDVSTGSMAAQLQESETQKMAREVQSTVSAIDRTVKDQQPQQEFNQVLTSIESVKQNLAKRTQSPEMPLGRINMSTTLVTDPVSKRQYTQLLNGPWLLNSRKLTSSDRANGASFDGERYWHENDFPKSAGTGINYAYWFRNGPVPEGQTQGTFHIAYHTAGPSSDTRCYGLFWETAGIWTDLKGGNPPYAYPLWDELNKSYTKKFQVSDSAWRHLAWVFDENDDTVTYYLDGQVLQKRKWGKPVKEMDCAPANVTVGHRYPGNTYHWDVSTKYVCVFVYACIHTSSCTHHVTVEH
jgi:hypothetical protein